MTTAAKEARPISPTDAAALVTSGDWVDYGAVLAQPDAFDDALAVRVSDLHDVGIRGCLSTRPRAVVEADPERRHVSFFNWHMSGYDRKQGDAGLQHYIPSNLGEIPDYYRRFISGTERSPHGPRPSSSRSIRHFPMSTESTTACTPARSTTSSRDTANLCRSFPPPFRPTSTARSPG